MPGFQPAGIDPGLRFIQRLQGLAKCFVKGAMRAVRKEDAFLHLAEGMLRKSSTCLLHHSLKSGNDGRRCGPFLVTRQLLFLPRVQLDKVLPQTDDLFDQHPAGNACLLAFFEGAVMKFLQEPKVPVHRQEQRFAPGFQPGEVHAAIDKILIGGL